MLDADDTSRVLVARYQMGLALAESGQLAEAMPVLSDVLAGANRQSFGDNDYRSSYTRGLALTMGAARRTREALALMQELSMLIEAGRPPSTDIQWADRVERARLHAYDGNFTRAGDELQPMQAPGAERHELVQLRAQTVQALMARLQGRPRDAAAGAATAWADAARPRLRLTQQAQLAAEGAAALLDLGDPAQAEPLVRQALALLDQAQARPSPASATAWIAQARLHLAAGRAGDAERTLLPLAQAWAETNPDSAWHGETLHWLAVAVARQGRLADARRLRQQAQQALKPSEVPVLRGLAAAGAKGG
jgi:tetratricopeptide (TPR) repeat protein